ncbi:putative clathrin assembly protein at1g14910 [Phtheirospermum japonicum]|uniref:Putative clathrin assembly protein at1g14910 n=1 Tax=Phtheirospermum japonicum TaxID=374723 RepID=A0A830BI40_9LAMI|nr:putative clathrin assembly protein at1g14910 [Phtheirospermum japonicum]
MGTLQSWRKAYGALKDHTKLGLAHVNSDFKDVDVAIVKATNHVECPPKERHLRKILAATSAIRPRADVAYCIHTLARRLAKTHNWTPEGAAVGNYVIQYALAFFFEMPRHEAIKALDIYKRAGQQANSLSDFYEICKGLDIARNFQFPVLREPPQSFLVTMDEYIKEAPRMVPVPSVTLEYPERLMLTYKEEDIPSPSEEMKVPLEESGPPPSDEIAVPTAESAGLNAITQDASAIAENNALALAIVPSGPALGFESSQAKDFDPTGWELALVTTPSTNLSSVPERQLAGGLDSLTLNSLYNESAYRAAQQQQQPVYGPPALNPFEINDPFAIPNVAPTHQNNPFASFQPVYTQPLQQKHPLVSPQNPFGDAGFTAFPGAGPQTSNPFGGPGIL